MKAKDDAIPKGLLDKQLEIMSRGLGDGRETVNQPIAFEKDYNRQ